jgi:putative aminopeptidase FrvX
MRKHRQQQATTGLFQYVTEAFPRREDWKLWGFGFQVSGWLRARLRIKNQKSATSASETLDGARRQIRKNTVETDSLLALIRAVLAQPTAPFHEDAVRAEIVMQLAQCPHVRVTQDVFGNIIAQYQRGNAVPRFAFAAHMDHPGFVGDEFLGGVPKEYLAIKAPTRDFGAFAMWDLPACEVRDGRIHSRACDDLISCAAILALFHELEKGQAEASVIGLFTRAEEVGFIGAIHLAKSSQITHDVTIVSLETSSERSPGAGRMGEGVIIRVGDKTSIFDDSATRALAALAAENKLLHQRCLMSGGTCEATAYQLYGYRTGALCVALGNYHNCGPDTTIAAEFVSVEDVQGMVRLLVAASTMSASANPVAALREKLEKGLEKYQRFA